MAPEQRPPRLIFVVNADWFFVSHRLRLGLACQAAGFDVHVAAPESDARATIEAAGLTFHPIDVDRGGTNPRRDAATLAQLTRLYRRLRPDVVHHVTIKPVLYGSLAARSVGVPAIVNAVSGLGYAFIPRERPRLRDAALRSALERMYRVALGSRRSRVIFQNTTDRQRFIERGLVRPERTVVLPGSGVDVARFTPQPLPEGPPVVLLPARLLWDKGVGEFVEAARIVKGVHPDARFVLAGRLDPGNPAAVPESTLQGWLADGLVEWWGAVPVEKMPGVYAQATLVALPSYREGLPLVIPEAGAVGRAAVTTDVPGCRDAIADGETGWLVPERDGAALGQAIRAALEDRAELERRSQAARALAAARFRQEKIFAATMDVYAALGVACARPQPEPAFERAQGKVKAAR